jgi:hypothetical protein
MDLLKNGVRTRLLFLVAMCFLAVPTLVWAEEFKVFTSEQYGFSMKYPASWVKIDNPQGNYYVVFHSPDLRDNFRDRIHVSAHRPVKDSLKVYLDELRNAIKDLQGKSGKSGQPAQQVKILDEGEFKCDVPGAYYFFIEALEDKLNVMMDIVIVFYKHDQTLLRVSCLAPSARIDQIQQTFNDVLVSVEFPDSQRPSAGRAPTQPADEEEQPAPVQARPAPQPPTGSVPAAPPSSTYMQREQPAPEPTTAPRPAPTRERRGPGRAPEPATGIVN